MEENKFCDISNQLDYEVLTDEPANKVGEVTELHLLDFAKWILVIVAFIYIGSAISELFVKGNAVYEACKVTMPSIATLVIGYYFGTSKK